jgi:alditol oxidase
MTRTSVPAVNWAGNVTFRAERVHHPASVAELSAIVAGARRIRALGTGHSFSRVADTAGDLVSLDRLPSTVGIDPAARTVTLAAGISYAELAGRLHRAGFALASLASLPHISVAGSVATGTHGSGDTRRCLSAAVRGLRLMGPDGAEADWRRGDAGFDGVVVALGALGVVTRLTLDIEPAFEVSQHVYLDVGLDEVAGRLDDVFGAGYSVSAFTDWRSGAAAVWVKQRPGHAGTGWRGRHPAPYPVHPVPGRPPEHCTGQLGVPGPWHERLPHFRPEHPPGPGQELQSELYLPRGAAPAAIAALRELGQEIAPVLYISELRTVAADQLWLSPACGRDSVTFHFTWIRDTAAVAPVLARVESRLLPLGGRPHWAKLTTAPLRQVLDGYPQGAAFGELMGRLDPAGKFRNDFAAELF